jgi:hypothetical protein
MAGGWTIWDKIFIRTELKRLRLKIEQAVEREQKRKAAIAAMDARRAEEDARVLASGGADRKRVPKAER